MIELLCKTDRSIATLFIRLALGAVMFAHGAQKVFGWWGGAGFSATIDAFTIKQGFPLWIVILLMIIELLGSSGLILGFLTRLSALGIATSMGACAYLYHIPNGFFMNWFGQQKGEGIEYHILVLGICIALIIQGGGLLSVDRSLWR
jgi:putative oxidoreductase